jgi:hypothetical protein
MEIGVSDECGEGATMNLPLPEIKKMIKALTEMVY